MVPKAGRLRGGAFFRSWRRWICATPLKVLPVEIMKGSAVFSSSKDGRNLTLHVVTHASDMCPVSFVVRRPVVQVQSKARQMVHGAVWISQLWHDVGANSHDLHGLFRSIPCTAEMNEAITDRENPAP